MRIPTLFPYTTLFRSRGERAQVSAGQGRIAVALQDQGTDPLRPILLALTEDVGLDPERGTKPREGRVGQRRSEEHTSELQSHSDLVCRLLLEKKNDKE